MKTEWKNHLRRHYKNSNIRQPIKTLNMGTYLHSTEKPAALTLKSVSQKNKWMGIIKQNFNSLPACPYHKVRLNPPKMQKPGCNSKIQRFFCLRPTASDIFRITGELSFYWSFSLVMRMVIDPSINLWVKISISFPTDIQSSSVLYQSKSLC